MASGVGRENSEAQAGRESGGALFDTPTGDYLDSVAVVVDVMFVWLCVRPSVCFERCSCVCVCVFVRVALPQYFFWMPEASDSPVGSIQYGICI